MIVTWSSPNPGDDVVTGFQIVYTKVNENTSVTVNVSVSDTTYILSGLSSYTAYDLVLKTVSNLLPNGQALDPVRFDTLPGEFVLFVQA